MVCSARSPAGVRHPRRRCHRRWRCRCARPLTRALLSASQSRPAIDAAARVETASERALRTGNRAEGARGAPVNVTQALATGRHRNIQLVWNAPRVRRGLDQHADRGPRLEADSPRAEGRSCRAGRATRMTTASSARPSAAAATRAERESRLGRRGRLLRTTNNCAAATPSDAASPWRSRSLSTCSPASELIQGWRVAVD